MQGRIWFVVLALAFAPPAAAYIDPNIGGWLYQILFPLLIAIAGAWAALRHKISDFFATLVKKLRGE